MSVRFKEKVDSIEVCVKDTGRGLDKNEIPRIFDLFHQTEKKITSKVKGTGLGLTITKYLIEKQDGTIEIASEGKGKGTSVCFSLKNSGIKVR